MSLKEKLTEERPTTITVTSLRCAACGWQTPFSTGTLTGYDDRAFATHYIGKHLPQREVVDPRTRRTVRLYYVETEEVWEILTAQDDMHPASKYAGHGWYAAVPKVRHVCADGEDSQETTFTYLLAGAWAETIDAEIASLMGLSRAVRAIDREIL